MIYAKKKQEKQTNANKTNLMRMFGPIKKKGQQNLKLHVTTCNPTATTTWVGPLATFSTKLLFFQGQPGLPPPPAAAVHQ